jgi:putative hydrolase of HD superfamily
MSGYFNRGKVRTLGDTTILGLGEIIRYNNRPKIKHENVAEHSFYVITTVLKIVKMFNLSDEIKYKALEFATVHDIPELMVGDIPYDTKVNNPALREACEQAEVIALEQNMPEYLDSYKKFIEEEKQETIPYLVTKLADTVSVLQYSNREISLGNQTPQMRDINEGAQERVARLIQKLEDKITEESK